MQNIGITPIIAHPERYIEIKQNPDLAYEWLSRSFIMQVDCGSILGHFGDKCKEIALELISNGCVQLIGSDAHNDGKRNFCLKPAYDKIESSFGINVVEKLKNNSSLLLDGKKLEIIESSKIFNNDKKNLGVFNKFMKLIKKKES